MTFKHGRGESEIKDKNTEAVFDEYEIVCWTQVCDQCAKSLGLLDSYLGLGDGHGICGVKGCERKADHYYDFDPE